MLNPGEKVVVDVRPHWWYLSRPAGVELLVIAASIAAVVESVPGWIEWLAVAALVLSAAWLAATYVRWATTRLVVTDTRLIERRGVLSRKGREIPISALTDIGYRQTIFGRIIGMGDVVLESAGKDSQEIFPDLPHAAAIHNEIYRQLEARRGQPSPGPATAGPSVADRMEQLDQLRRRGLITDEEFRAKRSDLLNRL
jgi:membrane protein YdbS with pleckstrin-like domain